MKPMHQVCSCKKIMYKSHRSKRMTVLSCSDLVTSYIHWQTLTSLKDTLIWLSCSSLFWRNLYSSVYYQSGAFCRPSICEEHTKNCITCCNMLPLSKQACINHSAQLRNATALWNTAEQVSICSAAPWQKIQMLKTGIKLNPILQYL